MSSLNSFASSSEKKPDKSHVDERKECNLTSMSDKTLSLHSINILSIETFQRCRKTI